jgi:CheY-like chemotaxis protein
MHRTMADDGPESQRAIRPDSPPREEAGDRRKTILLIEDSEADRDIYGSLLWYNGYEVVLAPDAPTGIAKALEMDPDGILLDMMLPGGMTGLDVMKRLREEGRAIPIIALTGWPEEELGEAVREAGAVAYIEKPVTPFEVVRQVLHHVGQAAGGETG